MSTPTELPPPPPSGAPTPEACPNCGAPLRPDQDWCLNCGQAVTTRVAGPPAWRSPIAIVGVVLLLAAAGLLVAFLELSGDAETVAQSPTPTPAATDAIVPTATPSPDPLATVTPGAGVTATPSPGAGTTPTATPSATPTTSPSGGSFADWPAGTTAYTVIMWSATTRSEAESKASTFQSAGEDVGILDSSDYSSLRGGYFVVFSGQYSSLEQAQNAAEAVQSTAPGAYAKQVKPK
jgi:hypothetical protein